MQFFHFYSWKMSFELAVVVVVEPSFSSIITSVFEFHLCALFYTLKLLFSTMLLLSNNCCNMLLFSVDAACCCCLQQMNTKKITQTHSSKYTFMKIKTTTTKKDEETKWTIYTEPMTLYSCVYKLVFSRFFFRIMIFVSLEKFVCRWKAQRSNTRRYMLVTTFSINNDYVISTKIHIQILIIIIRFLHFFLFIFHLLYFNSANLHFSLVSSLKYYIFMCVLLSYYTWYLVVLASIIIIIVIVAMIHLWIFWSLMLQETNNVICNMSLAFLSFNIFIYLSRIQD